MFFASATYFSTYLHFPVKPLFLCLCTAHLGVPLWMYGSKARGRLIWADRPFWGTAAVGRPRSSLESTFIRAATYYLLLCIHKAFFVYLQLLSRPILASSLTIFFLQGSASHAEGRACLNLSSFSPLNAEHIKSWLLRLLLSLFMRRLPTRRSEEPAVDERQPSSWYQHWCRVNGRDDVIQTQIQISAVVVRGKNYLSKKPAGARSS